MNQVIVVGPAPDSAGGIGVVMGHLSRTSSELTRLRFVDSGGSPGTKFSRLRAFGKALMVCGVTPTGRAVFHVNLSSGGSTWRKLVLTALLRARRRPYLLHLHGGRYPSFLGGLSRPVAALVGSMFRHADAVVVLGSVWQRFVTEEIGVAPKKVHVIPNAVPGPTQVPRDGREPTVLFTGKVTADKGVIELLQAWNLLPENVRTHLVLAGDLHDPDGRISHLLDTTPAVTATGWLHGEQLNEQLAAASVLVLPSHVENLPLSLLDGMAWGLAPVATDVGSVSEVIVDGQTGWMVPVNDPHTLAHAVQTLLLDPTRREAMARAARRRWESHYDIAQYRARLDDVYQLMGRRAC